MKNGLLKTLLSKKNIHLLSEWYWTVILNSVSCDVERWNMPFYKRQLVERNRAKLLFLTTFNMLNGIFVHACWTRHTCWTRVKITKTQHVHFTCQDRNMLKTLLRTNTVYIFAIQLIMVLVTTHVICTDFNYSYFLTCLSNASVNWLLQSHGKAPSPRLFHLFLLYIYIATTASLPLD